MALSAKSITSKLALVAVSSIIALTALSPASAAVQTDYGVWSEPVKDDATGAYSGTVTFVGSTIPAATYTTTFKEGTDGNDVTVQDASEEWISEQTPFGKVFGANGSSETNNYLKTGPYESATTVITFTTAVPEGSLGVVLGDLDVDSAVVTATNEAGADLTGTELVGTSTSNGFNLCDVTINVPTVCADSENKKDVPIFTQGETSVTFANSEVEEDIGVNAWLQPSVAVKTLTVVHTGDGTLRIGLAGPVIPDEEVTPTLADTGEFKSDIANYAAALIALGVILVMAARRRRSN